MLEYFYREKRTLVDFRRGPLGPHFDSFAAHLKAAGYCRDSACNILGKCCLFNAFLIEGGISRVAQISKTLAESFLDAYLAEFKTTSRRYDARHAARGALNHLFDYLGRIGAWKAPKPKEPKTAYDWLLGPYLKHLRDELELSETAIRRARVHAGSFLDALGQEGRAGRLKKLTAETVERHVTQYIKASPENYRNLAGSLRRFLRYCAAKGHVRADYSGLLPPLRCYRHAALPKGMEDAALDRLLGAIGRDSPIGARDYAIAVLMMAYGVRGISAAELLLDDIDWRHSRIRIRARKGGKEVLLPLAEKVGDAIIAYLRHRPAHTLFREVFLGAKAPFRPLTSVAISRIIRSHMARAGVSLPGGGSRTLRHSWAIRALGHNSAIKSIADVLGHRCIDTTFIYAKADLNALREVAMPWPQRG